MKNIKTAYTQSEGLRKITHNISWLFMDKILRLGVGLIVGVWVARYLGPERFGLWNYAIAFTLLFSAFATLGLDSIVIREIVKDSSRRDALLGSAFYLKLFAAIATSFITVIAISFIKSGDRQILYLVALSSIGSIFQSVNVIDFYFQAHVKSKYTVYALNSSFILLALVKVGLILVKAPLLAFAVAGTLEILFGSIFLMIAYYKNHLSMRDWKFSTQIAKQLLTDSWPLILSNMAIMIYMRIGQVMIGQMLGDREVGIYSAATKISEIWYFIPMSIVGSLFPAIIESRKRDETLYYSRLQKLFAVMAWLGISVAIATTFSGKFVMSLLYGAEYAQSGSVLVILIWAGIGTCLGVASSSWLMAENLQKYSFYRTGCGCVLNVLLNFFLIPRYGVNGAAIATVVSYFGATFSIILFKNSRNIGIMMLKSFNIFKLFEIARNDRFIAGRKT